LIITRKIPRKIPTAVLILRIWLKMIAIAKVHGAAVLQASTAASCSDRMKKLRARSGGATRT